MPDDLRLNEKWSQGIQEVCLGAGCAEGGSREVVYKVGAQTTLPFLFREGRIPHAPLVAAEVFAGVNDDEDWPLSLKEELGRCLSRPLAWAGQALAAGADLICLKFQNYGAGSADLAQALLKEIKTPLIVLGSGDTDKDNEVLPAVSRALRGERLLFGDAVEENYKALAAACVADGHNIIAESPIDVNIAKQLNILISDLGLPLDRIVINPTIGALGYGLEYGYSIMERARIAGLSGDKMLAMPFICFAGQESWRAKEAKISQQDAPSWGEAAERGIMWEVITAIGCLQAGADIVTMRHPKAIGIVKKAIKELMKGASCL